MDSCHLSLFVFDARVHAADTVLLVTDALLDRPWVVADVASLVRHRVDLLLFFVDLKDPVDAVILLLPVWSHSHVSALTDSPPVGPQWCLYPR